MIGVPLKKSAAVIIAVLLVVAPFTTRAAGETAAAQKLMTKLAWRNIGPFIGGRVVAVAGVPSEANLFYFGGVQGGVWRSTDYGTEWTNISDGKIPEQAQTMGAIAVAASNPKVIYAGSGESDIRGDVDTGAGIYKTTNAGASWKYAGLSQTHTTAALVIDPKDPDVVYAASMGHVFAANPDRGVFKTVDGGKTWKKILFVDNNTGAIDVVMDPSNPRVLYASMWQAQRVPWKLTSGGPGSGLYKTDDGGVHWTAISNNPGFAHGVLGRMGVSVAATNPRVVYVIVQAHAGGVFRSDNGGATWRRVNSQMKLRQRAFYYMSIYADPTNARVAYVPEVDDVFKTTDGGVTWKTLFASTYHGDHHIIWINPHNPQILLEGDDGGATVSTDGGRTWSSEDNQPTGQFYHIALDGQFPFHVYGASQDEGAFEGPSAVTNGAGEILPGAITLGDWHTAASGESTFVAPEPGDPDVTYGSGYYSAMLRQDNSVGQAHNVTPWAEYFSGASAAQTRYRFGWTHPILFSPADPHELLVAAQSVFSSTDHGRTWQVISPDLTRNAKGTEGPSGGPIDLDQTGAETFPDIASLAVSPLNADLIWAGSADGLVHITRDHGKTWTSVTPPALPQWAQISSIEPSHTTEGAAYLTASRYMWDDFRPYVYATADYGAHWTPIVSGIADDQYVFAVRQDPREPKLLLAGTRSTVYVSFDGGGAWQPLTLNLPGAQVRDIAIDARQGEVAVATHGRAFWILDDLTVLEQLARDGPGSVAGARLFTPEAAWLSHAYGAPATLPPNTGKNPNYGAALFFNLPPSYDGKTAVTLTFRDERGTLVRTFALHPKPKHEKQVPPEVRSELDAIHARALDLDALTAVEPGMNRFVWDLRCTPATEVVGFREPTADDFSASVDGPTIVPGTYTVTLQYASTTLTQPLHVLLDPRLHPTAEDLDARLALEMQIHTTLDALDRMLNLALTTAQALPDSKRREIDATVGELVQLQIHSSEGDVLHETKVREQLAFLANALEIAYEKPTAAEYAAYGDLKARAEAGEQRLQSAMLAR
jgi:photosystem II stability/assembly factor-like uncharacterized protein